MRWQRVKHVLEVAGNIQARILLTLVYILVAVPTGIVLKIFRDPLQLKHARGTSNWKPKEVQNNDSTRASRQH